MVTITGISTIIDGPKIKKLREEAGYSQEEFAKMVATTQSTISYLEKRTRTATIELFYRIALALDQKLDDLIVKE